jgi:hypothetical protein
MPSLSYLVETRSRRPLVENHCKSLELLQCDEWQCLANSNQVSTYYPSKERGGSYLRISPKQRVHKKGILIHSKLKARTGIK